MLLESVLRLEVNMDLRMMENCSGLSIVPQAVPGLIETMRDLTLGTG